MEGLIASFCLDWWEIIRNQLVGIYIPDICIAEAFKVGVKCIRMSANRTRKELT